MGLALLIPCNHLIFIISVKTIILKKSYAPPCIDVEEVVLKFAILGSGSGSFGTQSLNSEDVDEDE